MAADAAVETHPLRGGNHRTGEHPREDAVAADMARRGVTRALPRGEYVLPSELLGGTRELSRQGERQRCVGSLVGHVAVWNKTRRRVQAAQRSPGPSWLKRACATWRTRSRSR